MIAVEPATVAAWTGGELHPAGVDGLCRGLSTDTRTLAPGNLFVCLRGPRFDGHDFAADAARAGAAALVTEHPLAAGVPEIVVDDTQAALSALGAQWRAQFPIPVVAITGSNGKTTVKECLAAILRQQYRTHASRGNLNNEIGVPLMLCELGTEHQAAVFELASNHPGEIAALAASVAPEVAVITNADAAHLEGFGSLAAVAAGNTEIISGLAADGTLVLPADDHWTTQWRAAAGARPIITFGDRDTGDVTVTASQDNGATLRIGDATTAFALPLAGAHNRRNAAAAAAAAHALGLPAATIAAGLATVEPVAGRLVARRGVNGCHLLDDSYNANPGSLAAALAVTAAAPAPRWAVLGEMAELGADAAAAHQAMGEQARAAGIERLWALGPHAAETCAAFGPGAAVATDVDSLTAALREQLDASVTLLVKGSRSNRLERLVGGISGEGR